MKRYIWQAIAIFYSLALSPILAQEPASTPTLSTSTYSFFGSKVTVSDPQPIEIGMKFRTDVNGEVSAIRFYREVPIDSGYTAHLWSTTGELLGEGVAIEGQGSTPGWQTIQLYPPVPLVAGQTYIASYYASQGQYTISENFFNQRTIRSGPLYLLSDGEEGGNGVYVYGTGGGFPTETYQASNYWVDVIFKPTSKNPIFLDQKLKLTAIGDLAGLGSGDVLVTLTAQADTTVLCYNQSTNQVQEQKLALITVVGSEAISALEIENGNVTFSVTTNSPTTPILGAPDCPNTNWTESIVDLAFTAATIAVQQPTGTTVLTVSCSFSATSDSQAARDVSCTVQ